MSAPAFVMLTQEQLAEMLDEAVIRATDLVRPSNDRALLDRNGLAISFGCSASLVDKLRREGMPCVMVGCSPRYELDACLEWLKGRS